MPRLPLTPCSRKSVGIVGVSGGIILLMILWIPESRLRNTAPFAQTKDTSASQKASGPDDLTLYIGASSCSGSACHGSTSPRTKLNIGQNEFYIWSEKDGHAKAYEVLSSPDAKLIAKNLKIARPEESERCLVCHAVPVSQDRKSKLYDVTEGVSCEACHGPAERWLGPHTRKDWDSQKGAALGMYATKDLAKRAQKCLECHAGTEGKIVDHELIGAGHPRLKFELDNFSHAMPAHWKPPKDKPARDWLGARAWATGQAVALRTEISLLISGRKSRVGFWPDLAHFNCYSCHHGVVDRLRNLTDQEKSEQRWRFKEYDGKPGRLVWNASSYLVFRHIVKQVSPEESQTLEHLIQAFQEGLSGKGVGPDQFASTLTKLADLSNRLVSRVGQFAFTQPVTLALMKSISADGRRLAEAGPQSAEQAVLALASLYDACIEGGVSLPEAKAIKEEIDALYKDIRDARAFNQSRFEAHMSAVHRSLSKSTAVQPPR